MQVYCMDEETTELLNGIDIFNSYKCTVVAIGDDMTHDGEVLVRCGGENEEAEWLPEQCCERFAWPEDAPIFDAGEGLHYAVYREPEPTHRAMHMVAKMLAAQGDIPRSPMLILYRNSAYRLAPDRVVPSKQYGDRVYRAINRRVTFHIDDKRCAPTLRPPPPESPHRMHCVTHACVMK
jgi:hypothetical protein